MQTAKTLPKHGFFSTLPIEEFIQEKIIKGSVGKCLSKAFLKEHIKWKISTYGIWFYRVREFVNTFNEKNDFVQDHEHARDFTDFDWPAKRMAVI